ncbi:MAG: PhzF family phenazine biosynthesis protein [Xanthomonadales bacterium]|nr:PhzF family phenazine biosynthesis protein [Xanthomonadales bacterium]
MRVEVHMVNAFVDGDAGGNPAGVVLDANALTEAQMQEVARQVAVSETAFVSASETATIKLDFFTPNRRIAHCGHATIGTFCLLRELGRIGDGRHSKETVDGNIDIVVEGAMTFMRQRAPTYTIVSTSTELGARVLASLGLTELRLMSGVDPFVVNTGNSFLLVAVSDEALVAAIEPDLETIHTISDELDLIGFYVFSKTTRIEGRHAGARMFAPRYGIPEESATGMAAGPLGCFLHDYLDVREPTLHIEQGWLMSPPSPSVIKVTLNVSDGKISGLMAGGGAKAASILEIEI